MGIMSHISKWGTSLAVRIPKSIAQQWDVQEGSAVEFVPQGDAVVLRKRSPDLARILAEIGPTNLHSDEDLGAAQGKEEC